MLANAQNASIAGATPKELATGSFAMLPLWRVGSETGADFDVAFDEVRRNTMPMRAGITQLDAAMSAIYKENILALRGLNKNASKFYDAETPRAVSQSIFAIATLTNNRHAVQVFVDKVQALSDARKVKVRVDEQPILNAILDADGDDVGRFLVVNVAAL